MLHFKVFEEVGRLALTFLCFLISLLSACLSSTSFERWIVYWCLLSLHVCLQMYMAFEVTLMINFREHNKHIFAFSAIPWGPSAFCTIAFGPSTLPTLPNVVFCLLVIIASATFSPKKSSSKIDRYQLHLPKLIFKPLHL